MTGDDLTFADVTGPWQGNGFPKLKMTGVWYQKTLQALVCLTNVNIDYDGAPNAYGPPELDPLDELKHAGQFSSTGYYAIIAIHPDANEGKDKDGKPVLIREKYKLQLDDRFPDKKGRQPVVQQTGRWKGYYISTTSTPTRSLSGANRYDPTTYIDSANVAYGALSKTLDDNGVDMHDYGAVIRHDNAKSSGFYFKDAGHNAGPHVGAVGEVSYKVYRNLGGLRKPAGARYANNNFPVSFLFFPNSRMSKLSLISKACNADDLIMLLAYNEEADYIARDGKVGIPLLEAWVAGGRTGPRPKHYGHIRSALHTLGFVLRIGDFPTKQQLERVARTA